MKYTVNEPVTHEIDDDKIKAFLAGYTKLVYRYRRNEQYAEDIVHEFIQLFDQHIEREE